jgi:hypothetical protein
MFKEFGGEKNNTLKINLKKSLESMNKNNVTFSKRAIDDTTLAIQTFITAKLLQFWNENDIPPSEANIEIEVKIES